MHNNKPAAFARNMFDALLQNKSTAPSSSGCCAPPAHCIQQHDNESQWMQSKEVALRHLTLFGVVSIADEESVFFLLSFSSPWQARSSRGAHRMGALPAHSLLWVLIFTGITGVCGKLLFCCVQVSIAKNMSQKKMHEAF